MSGPVEGCWCPLPLGGLEDLSRFAGVKELSCFVFEGPLRPFDMKGLRVVPTSTGNSPLWDEVKGDEQESFNL